jgi:hypothetical protein
VSTAAAPADSVGGTVAPAPSPSAAGEACPLCGAPLHPEQEWCLRCGAAARTRLAASPNWRAPLLGAVIVAVLSLGVLAAALVKLAGDSGPGPPAATTTVTTAATTPALPAVAPTTPAASTAVPAPGTPTPTATTPSTPAQGATQPGKSSATPGKTGSSKVGALPPVLAKRLAEQRRAQAREGK